MSSPSTSTLSSFSLDWTIGPISDATTCTNVSINWDILNAPSDLSAILPSTTSTIDLTITISGFNSSVSVPLKIQGTAEQILEGPMSIMWFANVPAGLYGVTGFARVEAEQGSSEFDDTSSATETAFSVHQGADTSCIPSNLGSSSSTDFQTGASAQPHSPSSSMTGGSAQPQSPSSSMTGASAHSHSSSNTGAIVGGVVGGTLALALLTARLFFFLKRRQQHRCHRCGHLSGDTSNVLAKDDVLVSSNRERAMRIVSTAMPNSSDSGQSRNSLLTQDHGIVGATETSTGALFNSHAITPFQIPSLPVGNFEEEKTTHDDPRPLPLVVQDSRFLNDAAYSSLDRQIRSLPNPFVPGPQIADSGSTHAAAEGLERSTPFSRLSSTTLPEEVHADSGVRLGRETLLYDETNSEWSLRSKDRPPPLYSHN